MTTIDRVFSRFEREHEQGWYGRLGVLQLHLSGPPDHHLYAIFGAQGVALIEGVHPDPAAALTLPARLFLLLMERAEFLDLRTLLYLRGVELRGDRTLIYQVISVN